METEVLNLCPECRNPRKDMSTVCTTCGAPPERPGNKRAQEEEVRTQDLEPYVALRYIARLFKVLAVLMVLVMLGEVITGLMMEGGDSFPTLIAEVTRMLLLAGLMWGAGDITVLLIDMGHDVRVVRILLGRINAQLHRRGLDE